jgi:hypothetical protein
VTHEKFIATLLQFQYRPYASRYTITCAGMQTAATPEGLMCEIREKNHNGHPTTAYVSATLITDAISNYRFALCSGSGIFATIPKKLTARAHAWGRADH